MPEWTIGTVCKTVEDFLIVGSNPTPHTMKTTIDSSSDINPYYEKTEKVLMERKEISTDNFAEALRMDTGSIIFGQNIPFELTAKTPDSQTEKIVRFVVNSAINLCDIENLSPHLPNLGVDEVSTRVANLVTSPLKRFNDGPFGSKWNEWTAQLAAQRLGLPASKVSDIIKKKGPLGEKLRSTQELVAREVESILKRRIQQSDGILHKIVALETFVAQLNNNLNKKILEKKPELTESEKDLVLKDTLIAILRIIDFAANQKINFNELTNILLNARLGEKINIVDLHCLSFVNTSNGIFVSETAEDFEAQDSKGNTFLISQSDILDGVCQFSNILSDSHIEFRVIILVIDNDKFVMLHQEKQIQKFISSLGHVMTKHPISKHTIQMVSSSTITEPTKFDKVQERTKSNKVLERMIDEEFNRLKERTVPTKMKTRRFAREIAKKSFHLQFALGSTLPIIFEPAIILQSTKAHQQATEVFRMGSKSVNVKPIIIGHWNGRKLIKSIST